MNKKYFLTFGAITTAASPIVAVVSCGDEEGSPTTPTGATEGTVSQIAKLFEDKTINKTYAVPVQADYTDSPINWSNMQAKLDNWCGDNPIELGAEVSGVTFDYKAPVAVVYGETDEREITIKIKKGTEEKEVTLKLVAARNLAEADSEAIKHIASKFEGLTVTDIERTAGAITTQVDQDLNEDTWNELTNSGTMSDGFKFPKRTYGTTLQYSVPTQIDAGGAGNIKVKVTKGSGTEVTKDVSLNLLAGQNGAATLSSASITLGTKDYTITQSAQNLTLTVTKGTLISKNDIKGWFTNVVGALVVTGENYDSSTEDTYDIVVTDPGTGSSPTAKIFNIAIIVHGEDGAITLKSGAPQLNAASAAGTTADPVNNKKFTASVLSTEYFSKTEIAALFDSKGTLVVEYTEDQSGGVPSSTTLFDSKPTLPMTIGTHKFTITDLGSGTGNPTPDVVTLEVEVI